MVSAPFESHVQRLSRLGRFTVRRRLGEGSFGVVWEVEDPLRRGVRLALKVLFPAPGQQAARKASAAREFRLASCVRHPVVCQALEAGLLEESPLGRDGPYILSEFCSGAPLRPPWRAGDLAPVASDLLSALDAIHAAGWRHGDIKPRNVLVDREEDVAAVRLLDFGLAAERGLGGVERATAGTPLYLAPEVLRGREPDHRADLYALGLLLYQSLAGAVEGPVGEHLLRTRRGQFFQDVCRRELPDPWGRLLGRLLDPEPDSRLQSGAEGMAILQGEDPSRTRSSGRSVIPAFEAAKPVGRRDFFDVLQVSLQGARSSRVLAGLLVVEGGPGLGKSRLIREAEAAAFVASVRSFRWETVRNLGGETVDTPRDLTGREEAWLQDALLASVPGASFRTTPLDIAAERRAAAIVDELTREPSVLLVDDADHLPSDERRVARLIVEKIRNLRQSRPRPGKGGPVIVYAFSPRALKSREFSAWWSRQVDLPWTTLFSLQPWAADDVAVYLDRVLPPQRRLGEVEDVLRRESAGRPARLRRLLQDLVRGGDLRLESGAWVCSGLPRRGLGPLAGDRERARQEWEELDRSTADLLGVSAVWADERRPVSLEVLTSALEVPLTRLHRLLRRVESLEVLAPLRVSTETATDGVALSRLQRLWILREAGHARRRAWRRLLVESRAPLAERVFQELKLGPVPVARILDAAGDSGVVALRLLAFHVDRGRRPPSERAPSALRLGEILLGQGEFRRARQYLFAARQWTSDRLARPRIEMLLGEAALSDRRPREAGEFLAEAARYLRPEDDVRPRLLYELAVKEYLSGNTSQAAKAIERALEQYPEHAGLLQLRAFTAMAEGDLKRAEEGFRLALGRAEGRGAPVLLGTLRSMYGVALRRAGKLEEAISIHRRAAENFEQAGLMARAARAYGNLGVALRRLGRYEEASTAMTRCAALHRELGDEEGVAVGEANLGILARELGLVGTAWRRFHVAEVSARAASDGSESWVLDHPAFLENRVLLALELGEEEQLRDLLSRREELLSRSSELRPETLLVELRLWRAGVKESCSDLVRLCGEREYAVGDGVFLAELALLRSESSGERAVPEALGGLVGMAREELRRLAAASSRDRFCWRLVELHDPESAAQLEQALADVASDAYSFPLRDVRRQVLRGIAQRASDPAAREKARGGLRRLLDEVLFDLDADQRKIYRDRREITEALELTRNVDDPGPASKRDRRVAREGFRFNQEILQEKRLDRLVRKIVDAAMSLTDAERGVLVMRERGCLRIVAARSGGRDLADPEEEISHTILENALAEGVARVTTDARADAALRSASSIETLGLRSILCVPLRARRSRIIGALYLDNPFERDLFDAQDLELAESFCAQAALAWAAAERRRETAAHLRALRASSRRLRGELHLSRRDLARVSRRARMRLEDMVGDSPRMREVFHLVEVIAPTDLAVLITGESGTGKELVARALHRLSPRGARSFVAENCGAIPAALLESALFGYTRGAFSGADRDSPGIFEMAEGGTLFLDEIGELAPELQSKLLRVLQERELRPLGARHTRKVNVRLVASTNRDVLTAIENGDFREDLYYRIRGAEIRVPSLRERIEDVPLLVQHFLQTSPGEAPGKQVSVEVIEQLCRYPWPGNVRELENEVRRVALLCPYNLIGIEYLSPGVRDWRPSRDVRTAEDEVRPVHEVVQDAIRRAMRRFEGRRQDVARALGISRTTLYTKLKEMGESTEDAGRPVGGSS